MISSYVGENAEFERQFLAGELEVELTPQVCVYNFSGTVSVCMCLNILYCTHKWIGNAINRPHSVASWSLLHCITEYL